MMRSSLVLTVIGPDRPGLVETLAATVAQHDGNWLESRLARLAGKFAGVLRIDLPQDQCQPLADALNNLGEAGLTIVVESSDAPAPSKHAHSLILNLIGHDRPGIVRDVSRALAQRGVNVVEFHTQVVSAAMTGDPLFKATAELLAPVDTQFDELRDALDQLAADFDLDLTLSSDTDEDG
jgi:glycine cleavage system regulatory protein